MNQSSFEVVEFGTAQNGKSFAIVSMRTPGVAKRVIRAVNAGEAINGRPVDGIGETYVGRDGRPVARVYFVVEAAPVAVEAAPVPAALVVAAAAVAVQLSLFGGAL